MRLYVSSLGLGHHAPKLLDLAGEARRTAVIAHAVDLVAPSERDQLVNAELEQLSEAGLDPFVLDLHEEGAVAGLGEADIVWVMGGNTFVLRKVLATTGADEEIVRLLAQDAVVYGGWSAGAVVLAPSLDGVELVDPIEEVSDPVTTGLAVLDRTPVPHLSEPGTDDTSPCDALAHRLVGHGQRIWPLRDGDVLVVNGSDEQLLQ